MAGTITQSVLNSISQDVYTELFFNGLETSTVTQQLAVYHPEAQAAGKTVHFPNFPVISATKTADGSSTVFQNTGPTDVTATAYEIQTAVEITRFAQATTPIKNPMQLINSMMSGLVNQVETDLLSEACTGPADSVGSSGAALTLGTIRSARDVLAGWTQNIAGIVLGHTGESSLIADSALAGAANYGSPLIIQNGGLSNGGRVYGMEVFMSPFAPANSSALVAKNTLHYAVLSEPSYDVAWDWTLRADAVVATVVVAVKYSALARSKGVAIAHT